ncbi:hypothetical protein NDU88_005549 [Pleurodeles waltl]|uniref:Uncharacterized protein n=1 Tax=Pleurodeles waltl TaxID=8319 RepID=A0AAV7MAT5_PLEWA|nr:hypothetical protein NDU88_005549 [Pleurodeles waltl]
MLVIAPGLYFFYGLLFRGTQTPLTGTPAIKPNNDLRQWRRQVRVVRSSTVRPMSRCGAAASVEVRGYCEILSLQMTGAGCSDKNEEKHEVTKHLSTARKGSRGLSSRTAGLPRKGVVNGVSRASTSGDDVRTSVHEQGTGNGIGARTEVCTRVGAKPEAQYWFEMVRKMDPK